MVLVGLGPVGRVLISGPSLPFLTFRTAGCFHSLDLLCSRTFFRFCGKDISLNLFPFLILQFFMTFLVDLLKIFRPNQFVSDK